MESLDLRSTLRELQRASVETQEAIDRLVARFTASPPDTIRALHDAKAELEYLRLALRSTRSRAAACAAEHSQSAD